MKTIKLHTAFIKCFFITLIALTLTNCSNKEDLLTDRISITNGITQIKIGEEYQLKYHINSEMPENYIIYWKSSAMDILSVSSNGKIQGRKEGKAEITLTAQSNSNLLYDKLSIDVSLVAVEQISFTTDYVELEEGDFYTPNYEIIPSNATNKELTWHSTDVSIAIVEAGQIKAIAPGNCEVIVESNNNITATIKIKVNPVKLYEVTSNEAGMLRDVLGGKESLQSIKKLKISGELNAYDIEDIRNMNSLIYLDLLDVKLVPGGVYSGDNTIEENVIDDWMFYNLNIKYIILPSSVTDIGFHAFDSCTQLEECILPKSLRTIGYCSFIDCSSLKEIVLPETLESIGYHSFTDCISITKFNIPDNVKFIDGSAFFNCTGIKELIIGSGVQTINKFAFNKCVNIETIYMNSIPNENTKFATDMFDESIYNKATLYIPKGSLDAFKHTPFENFKNIIEKK